MNEKEIAMDIDPTSTTSEVTQPYKWILGFDAVEKDVVQEAWLILPAQAEQKVPAQAEQQKLRIHLLQSASVKMWFDTGRGKQASALDTVWSGSLLSDSAFHVYFKASENRGLKLLASIQNTSTHFRSSQIVPSPAFVVKEKELIGATATSILLPIFTFLIGVFTHIIQKGWDNRSERRKKEKELFNQFYKDFVKEFNAHPLLLADYLKDPKKPLPPILPRRGFETISKLPSGGADIDQLLKSIGTDASKVKAYYKIVGEFNKKIFEAESNGKSPGNSKSIREELMPLIENIVQQNARVTSQ